MNIEITEMEAMALIQLKEMFRRASTPIPEFLEWIAARLTKVYKESEHIDFVVALKQHADELDEIARCLNLRR